MTKKTQRARARAEKKPRIGEEHIRPDGSVIRYVREEDDDRKPVDHYRTVDTLALMLRNGSITGAMHDAGLIERAHHLAQGRDAGTVPELPRRSTAAPGAKAK